MRPIDHFDRAAAATPTRPAFIGNGLEYTYEEARVYTTRVAEGLHGAGFQLEDAVAVFSPNDPRAMMCVLAALRAGGPWVPVNSRNAVSTNIAYMRYVKTRWMFYHSSVADLAREIRQALPDLKGVVCIDARDGDIPSLADFIEQHRQPIPDWCDVFGSPNHPVSLWPTGGTTGPSKGVVMTHRSWNAMTEMALKYWGSVELPVHLAVAPITHAAGAVAISLAGVSVTNVILENFDATAVLECIQRHRVTHVFLPPTAYYALLDHPEVHRYDCSSLRQLLIAAAPVSPDKLKEGIATFGPCICQCFGQAEAPMLISWLSPEVLTAAAAGDHPERLQSCGQPTSMCNVGIMDDQGLLLPVNARGEIVVRGPLVTDGYFDKPEATAEAHAHNWHHTGDVGYLDEHNYLYIVDRKKDMIITGGFNVFAAEVETPILALPAVRECAVIGVPDDKWGEAIKAIVVLKDGASLDEAVVIAYCREKLGGFKTPKSVEFWASIPKTPNGKTDKKEIRKTYWVGHDRAVN